MNYQIFSDSSCDTPFELIEKYGITLVPFYVSFDQEHYYRENIDISNQEFYEKLINEKIFPKTSLPSLDNYITHFEKAIKDGKDVLCLCLSHNFSGSYQAAVNAKNILLEQYPSSNIHIVNSILATAGQGLLLLQAAYMKEAGYSLNDNYEKLEELKETVRIMFTVDTLEYLAKGGRIGKATSLAGNMLNLKPLIILKDGELIPYSNVRGRKKALDKILAMTEEYFMEHNLIYEDYDFCIACSVCLEEALATKDRVEYLTSQSINYPIFHIGVTIGTNTGPGAVGVCFIKKYNA